MGRGAALVNGQNRLVGDFVGPFGIRLIILAANSCVAITVVVNGGSLPDDPKALLALFRGRVSLAPAFAIHQI